MSFVGRIEQVFRHAVVYPTFRSLLRNEPVSLPIHLPSVRRLLLLRTDRLGDMVVTSSLIHRIRMLHPGIYLGLVVSHKNLAAARLVDGIDALHVIGGGLGETISSLHAARRQKYDVVLNLVFNRTTLGGLLSNVIAPRGIKVGQGAEKYRFYFNAMVSLERGKSHMAEILRSFGEQAFGHAFSTDDLPYALHDDPEAVLTVESYISALDERPTLVNLSAGEAHRSPTAEQMQPLIREVLSRVTGPVVVTAAPGQESVRTVVVAGVGDPRVTSVPASGRATFAEIVALVRRSKLLLTPDTSLVHVAGATATPTLAFFSTFQPLIEWAPRNTVAEVVVCEPGQTLSTLPVGKMLEGLDRLLARLK